MKLAERDVRIDAYVAAGVVYWIRATHLPTGATVRIEGPLTNKAAACKDLLDQLERTAA